MDLLDDLQFNVSVVCSAKDSSRPLRWRAFRIDIEGIFGQAWSLFLHIRIFRNLKRWAHSVSGAALNAEDETLLEQVWGIYGKMSPFQLSDITHEENGPWHIATSVGGNYAPIPNELIQKHYEMKRMEYQKSIHAG